MALNLRELGYETILFTANPLVTPLFGFSGFGRAYEYNLSSFKLRSRDENKFLNALKRKYSVNAWSSTFKPLFNEKIFQITR